MVGASRRHILISAAAYPGVIKQLHHSLQRYCTYCSQISVRIQQVVDTGLLALVNVSGLLSVGVSLSNCQACQALSVPTLLHRVDV